MVDESFQIEIPSDQDGFVLLQCPGCHEMFKLKPEDIEDDAVLHLSCPACGIAYDNYFTDDVVSLAMTIAQNYAMREINKELKKLGRRFGSGPVRLEVTGEPDQEPEIPLSSSIDALVMVRCVDCGREMKVSPLLAMSAYSCPCCGKEQFNEC